MFDLLNTIAVVEDRPVSSVLADLANTNADTLTFRLLPEGPPGTIPLLHGADAVHGVRELLLTATYASTLPRPLLVQGRRPTNVWSFARQVRLGAPQTGSWIVAAHLTIPEAELDPRAAGDGPFARQVSLYAHRGVRAALTAAGEALGGDPVEPFLRRVDDGVSANLCEALARLGRDDTPFEVSFSWAQRLPAQAGAGRFRFDRNTIRVIRNAGEAMRASTLDGRVQVIGAVSQLSQGNTGVGTAVIDGIVHSRHGEAEQKVTVRLRDTAHQTAIEAYRTRQFVRLTAEARRGHIETVLDVAIVPPT
ncbi:hypothetical protein [Phytohabitans rumicis]|nr:hypothetical protein [Phytohabitans rumicis]